MLSKSATMLMGLIKKTPLNAYEMVKQLAYMNVKNWYNIANSTVYATMKSIEKKGYVSGKIEKDGNMPDKIVYTLTESGQKELLETLRQSILQFDYDTNICSIAVFFIEVFPANERKSLLEKRLEGLHQYLRGIEKQVTQSWEQEVSPFHAANVKRMIDIVKAEILGTQKLLSAVSVDFE